MCLFCLNKLNDFLHLLYRSKADESELDMTCQFDLDSSFKRMLDEKRQMTNKENNPPAVEQATSSLNAPEKPLRKDLLKERKFEYFLYEHGM